MKHLPLFLIATILFCGNLVTRAQDNDSVTLYFSAEEMPDLIKCLPPPPDTLGTDFTNDIMRYMWGKQQRNDAERAALVFQDAVWNYDSLFAVFKVPFGLEINKEGYITSFAPNDGKKKKDEAKEEAAEAEAETTAKAEIMGEVEEVAEPAAADVAAAEPAEAEPEVAEPVELPPALATDEAMALWRLVQAAGYVDKNYQPVGLSATQMAYLAHRMAEKLGITNMWALFQPLWHRKHMGSAYGRSIDQDQTKAFRLKLNQLFSDV
jgi:hypothetical protein